MIQDAAGPIVAVSDYVKAVPDMIGRFVGRTFVPLGTDGFGRSDTREELRRFFEIDAAQIVYSVLWALHCDGEVPASKLKQALRDLKLNTETADPAQSDEKQLYTV
jgi:pyruvate dehydrogenase E1 component